MGDNDIFSRLNDRHISIILASIIILSFLLRIYKLGSESIWGDEAVSIQYMAKSNVSTIIQRVSSTDYHPPLYYIILHFWIKLFGDSEFSTRFVSSIFGVFSVYILYKLGKEIFNKETGIISAFILSISLFHISLSREVRSYALLAFLILLSNYYFVKILKAGEKDRRINSGNAIWYIVSTTIMAYTHIFGLFYIIFQNIYYLFIFKKDFKFWIKMQSIIFVLFIPYIYILINQIGRAVNTGVHWMSYPTLITPLHTLDAFAGKDVAPFLILGIIGIISRKQILNWLDDRIFLLAWLFFPILIALIISSRQPIYGDRYLIGSLPALILIVSKGVIELTNILENYIKKGMIILILISILIIILTLPVAYSLEKYYRVPHKDQWRELANYIEQNKGDNDFILTYYYDTTIPFSYYYKKDTNFGGIYGKDACSFTRTVPFKSCKNWYSVSNLTKGRDGIWEVIFLRRWDKKFNDATKLTDKILLQEYTKQYTIMFIRLKLNYYLTKRYEVDQLQFNQSKIINLVGDSTKMAQKFIPKMKELDAIQLRTGKFSDEMKVYIQTNNALEDKPSGITISNISTVRPNKFTNFTVKIGRIILHPGDNYWIIIERQKGNISFYGDDKNKNAKIYKKNVWYEDNSLYFKTLFIK